MISRRHAILLTLATTAATSGLYLLKGSGVRQFFTTKNNASDDLIVNTGLGEPLDNLLRSLFSNSEVGESWWQIQDDMPTLDQIIASLSKTLNLNAPNLETELATEIRKDFSEGKLCTVDGWQLSLTECQLAALVHLAISEHQENTGFMATAKRQARLFKEGIVSPVSHWEPQKTLQGKKFNEPPNGKGSWWRFHAQGAPSNAVVTIDGKPVQTWIQEHVIAAGIYGEAHKNLISTPGSYEISLIDPIKRIRQHIGEFIVTPNPSYAHDKAEKTKNSVFCEVTRWGPQQTQVGIAANSQPDSSMGIWVYADCLPESTQIMLEDDLLPAHLTSFGLTAEIPLPLLETQGGKSLYLIDMITGEKKLVGTISIN